MTGGELGGSMTKKHFEALAEALSKSHVSASKEAQRQWEEDCKTVAWVCYEHNPRFDRQRFLNACGVK